MAAVKMMSIGQYFSHLIFHSIRDSAVLGESPQDEK